jgi:GNAT superfamily N-acetyltransferase
MLSAPFRLDIRYLSQCQKLSAEPGWNQNEADWSFILQHGFVLGVTRDDRLVATAGVVSYGKRFGWICMVLVTAAERRQGLASVLMRECMQWLSDRNSVAGLDATPAGRVVYRQFGFKDVYPITRFQRLSSVRGGERRDETIRQIQECDLGSVADYDSQFFGERRLALLQEWHRRMPHAAFQKREGRRMRGYVLAREGRVATQIGPLVADSEDIAVALLEAALCANAGLVFMDVPDRHRQLRAKLEERDFVLQRTFTRMLLGHDRPLDKPGHIFALTGPEFG